MARSRILKAEFFRSRSLSRCSVAARLTFIGLWAEADDRGRGIAEPRVLKGSIWPLDDDVTPAVIASHLCSLVDTGHIRLYTAEGEVFYHVTRWEKHQAAAYRRGEPKYPDPDDPAVCTILHADECRNVPSFGVGVGVVVEEALAVPRHAPVAPPAVGNQHADADDFDKAVSAAVQFRLERVDEPITNLDRWTKAARLGITKDYGHTIRRLLNKRHSPEHAGLIAVGGLEDFTPAGGRKVIEDHPDTCECEGSGWVLLDEESRTSARCPVTAWPDATVHPIRGAS